jgi:hypothetical protein
MLRTTAQTINAIKGCLRYLLVETDELKLDRIGRLLRSAISDLEELSTRLDAGETIVHRPSPSQNISKDRLH